MDWPPASAKVYGTQLNDPHAGFLWVQQMQQDGHNMLVLSRLAPRRLSRSLHLDTIQFRWLTERNDPHALQPSLEQINHFITTNVDSDSGIIWLDCVEYLSDMHGFDPLIHFIDTMSDTLFESKWTVVLPYSPLAFSSTQLARLRRIAPNFDISTDHSGESTLPTEGQTEIEVHHPDTHGERESGEVTEIGVSPPKEEEGVFTSQGVEVEEGLVVLSRIPENALSRAILARRLEQWAELGFDISEAEPLLLIDERAERFRRYFIVEELVRRASECERRIRELEALGFTTEATKLRFRIMQLTGIDDVEETITRLLAEAR